MPKRVMFAITGRSINGTQVFVSQAIRTCLSHQADVGLIVGAPGLLMSEAQSMGIPVWEMPSLLNNNPISNYKSYRAIRRLISEFAPDVISTHSSAAGSAARLAAHRMGVPRIIFRCHGWPFSSGAPRWRVAFIPVERYLARFTDAIVCVSDFERQLALKHNIGSPEKLSVVYNGLHIDEKFTATPRMNGPMRLLSVGRIDNQKDPLLFVETVAEIHSAGLPVHATMIGEGPLRADVEKAIAEKNLGKHIDVPGDIPHSMIPEVMASHHALVMTSRWEPLGRVVLEAMSVGLPVVALSVGGIPEMVQHGKTGLLIQHRDPKQIAEEIVTLLGDQHLWSLVAQNGKDLLEQRFVYEHVMDQYWNILSGA